MSDTPWLGDACSLVDAFRAGERSPVEELDATLGAIEASDLNAFVHLDPERARAAAESADTSRPFGGVPIGIKALDHVEGWPVHRGVARLPGRRRHLQRHDGRPPARRRRRHPGRPHARQRVRRPERLGQSPPRRVPQPLAAREDGRRLIGRIVGRGRGWPRHDCEWRRRRRLDPHPRRVQRPGRHEGHRWPHPSRPDDLDPPHDRGARLHGPLGPRRLPLVRRHQRLRHPRSLQPPADRWLGAGPRQPRAAGQEGGDRPHVRRGRGSRRGAGARRRRRGGPRPRRGTRRSSTST